MTNNFSDRRPKQMYADAYLDDYRLDVYSFRIYMRIVRRAGHESTCYESIPNMAEGCLMSVGQVKRSLKTLIKYNLIQKISHSGKSSEYALTCTNNWADSPGDLLKSGRKFTSDLNKENQKPGRIRSDLPNKENQKPGRIRSDFDGTQVVSDPGTPVVSDLGTQVVSDPRSRSLKVDPSEELPPIVPPKPEGQAEKMQGGGENDLDLKTRSEEIKPEDFSFAVKSEIEISQNEKDPNQNTSCANVPNFDKPEGPNSFLSKGDFEGYFFALCEFAELTENSPVPGTVLNEFKLSGARFPWETTRRNGLYGKYLPEFLTWWAKSWAVDQKADWERQEQSYLSRVINTVNKSDKATVGHYERLFQRWHQFLEAQERDRQVREENNSLRENARMPNVLEFKPRETEKLPDTTKVQNSYKATIGELTRHLAALTRLSKGTSPESIVVLSLGKVEEPSELKLSQSTRKVFNRVLELLGNLQRSHDLAEVLDDCLSHAFVRSCGGAQSLKNYLVQSCMIKHFQ